MTIAPVRHQFADNGFVELTQFFKAKQLFEIKQVVVDFHTAWCASNQEFYKTSAINSSGLTSTQYLSAQQRLVLFKLISDSRLNHIIEQFIPSPVFMNTQLFFDPVNPKQKNYWHRDPQYHLTLKQQQQALAGPQVLHVRVPLKPEPGIELIPGSHKNWDNDHELQVRLELDGHHNYEPLPNGQQIALQKGDVLVFSGNMIHRGLYGQDRLALDILYCEPAPQILEFIRPEHQPDKSMLAQLNASLFLSAKH